MSIPHPEMAAILDAQRAAALPALETLPLATARAQFLANNRAWNEPLPPLDAAWATIGGVRCRTLSPAAAAGTVVFVHGGGWTFGAPESHERFARLLAVGSRARVIVPDYRLAPEHPAPAAIEDVLAVIAALPDDAGPLVLAGDSAGANIILAAAQDGPAQNVALLSLLYGCFAPSFETESHRRFGGGAYGLTTARMRIYWGHWLGTAADPRAVPLRRTLSDLPPCHVVAAGLDPLLDDSLDLAAGLAHAGVPLRLDVVPGVVHGFLQMTQALEPARTATRAITDMIAAALQREERRNP